MNEERWKKLLHHVTIQVLTLQAAGRNVLEVTYPRSFASREMNHTSYATFNGKSGTLDYATPAMQEKALADIPQTNEAWTGEPQEHQLALHLDRVRLPETDQWMKFPLQSPDVKFAVSGILHIASPVTN